MPAELISLTALCASDKEMRKFARRLIAGETGIYPTETIYGIGGRGDRPAIDRAIRKAKGRGGHIPFILLAARQTQFDALGLFFPPAASLLTEAFWPDRLTVVVPNKKGGTTGIRLSSHPLLVALSPLIDFPLISTSANRSGHPYNPDPPAIFATFRERVDFMVDAGRLPPSPPSTVVSIDRENRVVLLREGALKRREIAKVVELLEAQ